MMSTLDVDKFKQLMINLGRGKPDIFSVMDMSSNLGQTGIQKAPELPLDLFGEPSDWWELLGQGMADKIGNNNGSGEEGNPGQPGNPLGPPLVLIEIEVTEGFIIIRCQGEVLFDTLRDTLKPDGITMLTWIMDNLVMEPWNNGQITTLSIEGHADIRPIPASNPIRSNRLLSTMRAETACDYIVSHYGLPNDRVSIAGWGEFHPIDGDDGYRGNGQYDLDQLSKNRRVEFILSRNFAYDQETGDIYGIER